MGGGGATSGGTYVKEADRPGALPRLGAKPNSRYDLYINGVKVQSRWYDHEGKAIRNRDYVHQDAHHNHTFPHDHAWDWVKGIWNRIPENLEPDYSNYH